MNFWTTSHHTYQSFADLSTQEIKLLVKKTLSRQDIVEWLSWNDSNGIYEDEQSLKELGNIMSKDEGIEIMLRQIEEGKAVETAG